MRLILSRRWCCASFCFLAFGLFAGCGGGDDGGDFTPPKEIPKLSTDTDDPSAGFEDTLKQMQKDTKNTPR